MPDPTPDALALVSQKYQIAKIDAIQPHPKNPRKGDGEKIDASLDASGFYGAIYVQRSTGNILAGNNRWLRSKAKGLAKIPVIYLDVDDATALRILLADNATSDGATYDNAALTELLNDLAVTDGGLSGSGYDGDDLAGLLAGLDGKTETAPDAFPTFGDDIATDYCCPSCGFEWSGKPK